MPVIFAAILIMWSSIYLKRHTINELIGGMLVNVIAFTCSLIITTLV